MGAIQNSLNSIMGTAAVGAYAAGKVSDIKQADIVAGEAAKKEVISMAEDMPEIKNEIEAAKTGMANVLKDEKALGDIATTLDTSNQEDVKAFAELNEDVNKDRKMAELAMSTVEGKMKARSDQVKRLSKTIERAQRWTGGRK